MGFHGNTNALSQIQLTSLHDMTLDSTKLLKEKLSLDRELSALKPEVESLREQVAAQQSAFADKSILQQQYSTLQAELEKEKRCAQRSIIKERKLQMEGVQFQSQIEVLKRDLQTERQERQKVERDAAQNAIGLEGRNEALESRLETLRMKLRSTKDHVREIQENTSLGQQSVLVRSDYATHPKAVVMAASNARKRKAGNVEVDTTFGTPGTVVAMQEGRRASTLPGDKSMFSTTPFLNRTASLAHEDSDNESPSGQREGQTASAARGIAPEPIASETHSNKTLNARNKGAKPARPARAPLRQAPKGSSLELVAEEEDYEIHEKADHANYPADFDIRKKKRRVLGSKPGSKTLFDDDGESAATNRGMGGLPQTMKFSRKLGTRSELGANPGIGSSAFSPLKRDRRAGTSFIG